MYFPLIAIGKLAPVTVWRRQRNLVYSDLVAQPEGGSME
jgi:hypothetical protein